MIFLKLSIQNINVVFFGQLSTTSGILDRSFLCVGSHPFGLLRLHLIALAILKSILHFLVILFNFDLKIAYAVQVGNIVRIQEICLSDSCGQLSILFNRCNCLNQEGLFLLTLHLCTVIRYHFQFFQFSVCLFFQNKMFFGFHQISSFLSLQGQFSIFSNT